MTENQPGVPVDLRKDGVLWLINASVFHPRGFALAVDEDGRFSLLGDGSEPWVFLDGAGDDCLAAVEWLFTVAREGGSGSDAGLRTPREA